MRLHTPVPGECRWTFDTTTHWEYSACQAELPFRNGNHIKGTGKCESAPTSDLQTQDSDGQDINADVEIPSGYGIATRPSQKILVPKTDDFDDDGIEDPLTRITGIEKPLTRIIGIEADRHQSSGSADGAQEGEATASQRRRTADDRTGEHETDWSHFDAKQSLRLHGSYNAAVLWREVRKLRLRWWHATKDAMKTIFRAAGSPNTWEQTIVAEIDMCKEFQNWTLKRLTNTPSEKSFSRLNQLGEVDSLVYKDHAVFHDLDRCTSFHAEQEVCGSSTSSKSEDAPTDLYSTTWVTHHGSFETLYVDGKSSLTNPNAKARLHRLGTKVQARAPAQDDRFLERRGSVLRLCLPEAEDQCGGDT